MPESAQAKNPINLNDIHDAVCIHTSKVTDSFRDKDCIEDLRVYLTKDSQCALDRAAGARARYRRLAGRNPCLWGHGPGRTVYPHRSSAAGPFCRFFRAYAADGGGAGGVWFGYPEL